MNSADEKEKPVLWLAVVGICLGVFMFTLDSSIVNIAVPTLVREFNATLAEVQWVIQAYLIVIVLLLLPVGHFAERLGRKGVFVTGIILFTLGSFLCGWSRDIEWLIAFRLLQALGAVCMAALMSSMIHFCVPARRLGQALGFVTSTATLGSSLGPTIGGFLIDAGGWRLIFLVNVPIGLVALLLVLFKLPRPEPSNPASAGPGLAAYATLLRDLRFVSGMTGRMASMAANGAFLFLLPLLLENALAYSTSKAGLFLAAAPILIGATSPIFGSLADRYGRPPFLLTGQIAMILGILILGTLTAEVDELGFLLRVSLWAIGMSLFNAPNGSQIMTSAPEGLLNAASAGLSLSIMLGQLLGVAVGGALFHFFAFGGLHPRAGEKLVELPPETIAHAVAWSLACFAIPSLAAFVLYLFSRRARARNEGSRSR